MALAPRLWIERWAMADEDRRVAFLKTRRFRVGRVWRGAKLLASCSSSHSWAPIYRALKREILHDKP